MIFVRSVPNVMAHYGCTAEDAARYIDLRDEGYGVEQAAVMAGLRDPASEDERDDAPQYWCVKCNYRGTVQIGHQRPNGSGECGYIAKATA